MRYLNRFLCALVCVVFLQAMPSKLLAQASAAGSIEFQARIQPSGGRLEPARSIPFYLLRKSVADIRQEAERTEAPVDLDGFIDSLDASPELKTWMKKNHTVALSGTAFNKKLTSDDITGIPEFLAAYMAQNGASLDAGVPAPKFKEAERQSNPEKYKREHDQYLQAIKRYLATHPESTQDLDAQLGDTNPAQRWVQRQAEQQRKIERTSQLLARTIYLVAQVESDLEGRGAVRGLPPGTYWLATLDTPAMAGDVRLQWDVPIQVASGQIARVDLSNLNAVELASRPPR